MCGARPHPGRQPKGADAGLGSYVCLLTSPKRLPTLSLPPDAAVPAGPGLGPGCGLCRLSPSAAGLPKLRAQLGLGLGARSSGAATAAG